MKETTPAAMPPCFDKWCSRFDDLLRTKSQKREFRNYLGGLLGESERKNLSQMARDAVGVNYHQLHHFATVGTWSPEQINERRLAVMNQCSQTRINRGFSLIIDDSGHRKSGNFTAGVGRQYIGAVGKTDNGNVVVTTHLYDGKKSLPLDIELYQHSNSLPEGKEDPEFQKKPDLALSLITRTLARGYKPFIVLFDTGYGNNTSFLAELEKKQLNYMGGLAKNRKVTVLNSKENTKEIRLDELAKALSKEEFSEIEINLDKPRKVWVALVEVFYREVKGWLGLQEYQVRNKKSLEKHFVLVFCAYSFILWQKLTGGIRRRWASKPLNTFVEALEAFRTAISYRFVNWLTENMDVFTAYKASLGLIWA